MSALLLAAALAAPAAAESVDCGYRLVVLEARSGALKGEYAPPGMTRFPPWEPADFEVFLSSAGHQSVGVRYALCLEPGGAVRESGEMETDGNAGLRYESVLLSLPDLTPLAWDVRTPDATAAMTRLEADPQGEWDSAFRDGPRELRFRDGRRVELVERKSGKTLWTWAPDLPLPKAPPVDLEVYREKGRYYLATSRFGVFALDAADGRTLWHYNTFNPRVAPGLARAGGWLILGPVLALPEP